MLKHRPTDRFHCPHVQEPYRAGFAGGTAGSVEDEAAEDEAAAAVQRPNQPRLALVPPGCCEPRDPNETNQLQFAAQLEASCRKGGLKDRTEGAVTRDKGM